MFYPVDAFFLLSYTGMVYVLSCRGFLFVIVHRDTQGWCMFSPLEAVLMFILHRDVICSLL